MILKNLVLAAAALASASSCCFFDLGTPFYEKPTPPPATQTSQEPQPPQPKVICPMEWTSPTSSSDAGEMPPTGMVPFDWTDHPTASGYEMTVTTPNNSPVHYDTNGSSKNLFLENYKQVGSYQVTVTALDADGNPLCSISMNFDMPVVLNPVKGNNGSNNNEGESSDGNGSNPPNNGITIPPITLPIVTEEPVK